MNDLEEVRQKYPQYNDWSDDELAEGLYEKYYSDMSPSDYYKQIGMPNPHAGLNGVGEDIISGLKGALPKAGEALGSIASGLYDIGGGNIPEEDMTLANHLRQLVGMKTQGEKEHGYSPERFAKVIGSSLMKGGRGLLNVPGNIVDYAREKEIAPDWLEAWRPSEAIQNANYDEIVGLEGQRPGDVIPGSAGMIPSLVAGGGNPYAAIGIQSIGENENPIENMLAAKVIQKGVKAAPKAAKITAKSAQTLGNVLKKTKNVASKAYADYKESTRLAENMLNSRTGKIDAADRANLAKIAIEDTLSDYLEGGEGTSKANLARVTTNSHAALKNAGSESYTLFEDGKSGSKRIFAPIQAEFFYKQFSFPKDAVSETTQHMIDNIIGKYKETQTRDSLTGKINFKVEQSKVKPTVKQYIQLDKQLRDEVASFKKRAAADNVSKGDADSLHAKAKSLQRLRSAIQEKIKGSLSEKELAQYDGIQKFWQEYVTPFDDTPFLKNALKKGAIRGKNFLDKFDAEGLHPLKKALLDNPEFSEAVGKHDWRSINASNPKSVIKALESDLGKTLPEATRTRLNNLLKDLNTEQKTIDALTRQFEKDGLTKAEIDKRLAIYKKIAVKGGLGGLVGLSALKVLNWLI